jgi:choline dehydrogenase-like flavoprotein
MTQSYDFLIVGAGAGGGTLAYALAATGKQILLVERGNYLPREKENWDADAVFLEERYYAEETWRDRRHQPFHPETHYFVGGNTKVYGAVLQRMREADFGEIEHYDGISPAWELSYSDYEPYYSQAEQLYKIHGCGDEDPTEPPRSQPYPYPAFPHEPRIQEVADRFKAAGLHPFHNSLSLDRDIENPLTSHCIRCNTCDPFPCLVNAKCDAQTAAIDPALQYDNVTLQTNTRVTRLIPNEGGTRLKAVEAEYEGKTVQFQAETIILSCGAVNSARLLLESACDEFPNGIANSSGLVGRNLMLHNHSAVIAVSRQPNLTTFQKTLALNDFYFHGKDSNYPLGSIQLTGKAQWQRLKRFADFSIPKFVLKYIARHSVDFWVTTEDLPRLENRVYLDPNGQLVVDYQENNLKPHRELIEVLKFYLRQQGFYWFWTKQMPLQVVWHQSGTCKFGRDPKTSVLDLNCRAHDLENLYVVDSSFIPSMGAVNLTLTIVANSLRVADCLK